MTRLIKRLKSIKSHVGTRNKSILEIAWQTTPYFLFTNGVSFYPKVIFLSINSICNFKCKMCDVGQRNISSYFYKNLVTDGYSELSVELLKDFFSEVSDFKPLISITSTEPLLHKDIVKICHAAIESGLETQLTTNGYLLEEYADAFVDIGLHRLTVSLDGPPQIHNEIRGVKDSFERAKNGLKKIDELKRKRKLRFPELYIISVISNLNYFALVDTINEFNDINIEKNIFSHITFVTPEIAEMHNSKFSDKYPITPSSLNENIVLESVELEVLSEQIKILKRNFPNKCLFSPVTNEKDLKIYYRMPMNFLYSHRCFIPWITAQIIATGDVIVLTRCFNVSFGNIYNESFKQIWNNESFQSFRRDLRRNRSFPACSRCRGVL